MPKFKVDVCRIAYGNRTIEVEAANAKQAMSKAEDEAGSLEYSEHTAEYKAQTCVEVPNG